MQEFRIKTQIMVAPSPVPDAHSWATFDIRHLNLLQQPSSAARQPFQHQTQAKQRARLTKASSTSAFILYENLVF